MAAQVSQPNEIDPLILSDDDGSFVYFVRSRCHFWRLLHVNKVFSDAFIVKTN
jgi:hypothetical protein